MGVLNKMSKKTRSQDLNFEFTVVFDKEKETELQKNKRWIAKKQPPMRTVPYIYTGGWGPQYKVDRITDWDYPA